MSRHLGSGIRYSRSKLSETRAERRKRKGCEPGTGKPRSTGRLSLVGTLRESEVPADTLQEIREAQRMRQIREADERADWSPFDDHVHPSRSR